MPRVFDGEVEVAYHQATVETPGGDPPGLEETFAGQVNGLCGAAVAGSLFLTFGLHIGAVPVSVGGAR